MSVFLLGIFLSSGQGEVNNFEIPTGVPVSTTHTKTTAIMGVGASKRLSAVNWRIVREMTLAWVLTFPGCGLLGFLVAELFMAIF